MLSDANRATVMEVEAPPMDQQQPIFMRLGLKGHQPRMSANQELSDDDSSEEVSFGGGKKSSVENELKKIAQTYVGVGSIAATREPGAKKVSLHSSELKKVLLRLFQHQQAFKLNELSELL